MTVDMKLLERIKKLHNHAESAKQLGNEAEAAAFAAKVQELMAEHKLSFSHLTAVQQDAQDPLDREYVRPEGGPMKMKAVAWQLDLAKVLATNFGCYMVRSTGSADIILVGRDSDRAVAAYMITMLTMFAIKTHNTELRRARREAYVEGDGLGARGFGAAFYSAFVATLRMRFAAQRKTVEEAKGKGMALVLIDKAVEEADAHAHKTMKLRMTAAPQGRADGNDMGRAAGARAGKAADISGLNSNRVGGGRRALGKGEG